MKLMVVAVIFCSSAVAQQHISVSPNVSLKMPDNKIAFKDDKSVMELQDFNTGKLTIVEVSKDYKIDDIIVRISTSKVPQPKDVLANIKDTYDSSFKKRPFHGEPVKVDYTTETKKINNNEVLIFRMTAKETGFLTAHVYNELLKKVVKYRVEYKLIAGEKEKANNILNHAIESIEFK